MTGTLNAYDDYRVARYILLVMAARDLRDKIDHIP